MNAGKRKITQCDYGWRHKIHVYIQRVVTALWKKIQNREPLKSMKMPGHVWNCLIRGLLL